MWQNQNGCKLTKKKTKKISQKVSSNTKANKRVIGNVANEYFLSLCPFNISNQEQIYCK